MGVYADVSEWGEGGGGGGAYVRVYADVSEKGGGGGGGVPT